MIVYLPSNKVRATPAFLKEWEAFPKETREQLARLIQRYLDEERLSPRQFKTFRIDERHKILEFKVKDYMGNWRAISVHQQGVLFLIYAFHKKSQELLEKEKSTIRARIRSLK